MRATTRKGRATGNSVGRPQKKPYTRVSLYLTEHNKAWVESNGGITKAINALIQQAINSDKKCQRDNI